MAKQQTAVVRPNEMQLMYQQLMAEQEKSQANQVPEDLNNPGFMRRLMLGNFASDVYPEEPTFFPAMSPPNISFAQRGKRGPRGVDPSYQAYLDGQATQSDIPTHVIDDSNRMSFDMPYVPNIAPAASTPRQQAPAMNLGTAQEPNYMSALLGREQRAQAKQQAPAAPLMNAWQRYRAQQNSFNTPMDNNPHPGNPTYTER